MAGQRPQKSAFTHRLLNNKKWFDERSYNVAVAIWQSEVDEERRNRQSRPRGDTMGSTNFRSVPQRNDPSVTNHYFNTPGDGSQHDHVKEEQNADGTTSYPFVRDVEGNEYDAS